MYLFELLMNWRAGDGPGNGADCEIKGVLNSGVTQIAHFTILSMILLDDLPGGFTALATVTTNIQATADVAHVAGAVIQFFDNLRVGDCVANTNKHSENPCCNLI
jgi:hypothetical protein